MNYLKSLPLIKIIKYSIFFIWLLVLVVLCKLTLPTIGQPNQLLYLFVLLYLSGWGAYFFISTIGEHEKVSRFLLVTSSLLATITLLELPAVFQVIDYRYLFGIQIQPWEDHHVNILDKELIYRRKPNSHIQGQMVGDLAHLDNSKDNKIYSYDVYYDQNGFRNRSNFEKADCIVLGDSFLEYGTVPYDHLATTRLADRLDRTVINFGLSWYGPQQQLIVLKRYGVPLQPKICLWMFFEGNDLKDIWNYEKYTNRWKEIQDNFSSLKARSLTYSVLKSIIMKYWSMGYTKQYDGFGEFETGKGKTKRLYFAYPGEELREEDIQALTITQSILREAYQLCANRSIEFIVVFIPTKFRVYGDLCQYDELQSPTDWVVNNLPERLKAQVKNISPDIGFLDLTKAFKQEAKSGSLLYYPDDSHWSPSGHKLSASIIGKYLKQRM